MQQETKLKSGPGMDHRPFARDPLYNELFLWVHKCYPKALGIPPLIRYTSSYIESRHPFLPQNIQIFPVNHHVSIPPTSCCLHFTVPFKVVNFKALESTAETYLCESPPLPDWLKYSWLEHLKGITLKTALAQVRLALGHLGFVMV